MWLHAKYSKSSSNCFDIENIPYLRWLLMYWGLNVCSRGGARAGGEATLAVQRLPAGAQRVPAAATQVTQVPLHSHVTPPGRRNSVENRGGEKKEKDESSTHQEGNSFIVRPAGWLQETLLQRKRLKTPEPIGQRHRAVTFTTRTCLSYPGGTTVSFSLWLNHHGQYKMSDP